MRIITPGITDTEWFLTLFFREVGHPMPFTVGNQQLTFGRGRESYGNLAVCEMQLTNEPYAVSLLPGARILGVAMTPHRINTKAMAAELTPADEVELAQPQEVVTMDDLALASDVLKHNLDPQSSASIQKQLQILENKRRRFYAQTNHQR